ncbi:MAG: heme-binding protein, partial [Planctomycetota bacterium]
KRNKIAMTAPVEMTMEQGEDGSLAQKRMAFLYGEPEMGRKGRDGRVEVMDLEPMKVLSVGIRGPMSDDKVRDAREAILARLSAGAREGDALRRAGDWRLMGYNSPMVPSEKRFWELQLPVETTPGR